MEPLDAALIERLKPWLAKEPPGERALRVALLGLIFLVQDDAPPALRGYLEFLLADFAPLGDSFTRERCSFVDGQLIARRWVVDHTELLLHEEWLWDLLDWLNGDPHNN